VVLYLWLDLKVIYRILYKIIITVSIIIAVLVNVIYFVLLDRFIMGAVQRRSGPYVVGWFGLLQAVIDGLKLYIQRVIIVQRSNGLLFIVSPILFFIFSFLLWAIIPYYQNQDLAYAVDLSYSILFQLVLSSISVFALILSGWASNSRYSMIGALRSGAQVLS